MYAVFHIHWLHDAVTIAIRFSRSFSLLTRKIKTLLRLPAILQPHSATKSLYESFKEEIIVSKNITGLRYLYVAQPRY